MPQDERVSKFVAAITREAEEKRAVIEQETKCFVESEMQKAELDALNESYLLIQRTGSNIRNDEGSRISAGKLESRKQLLLRREEIVKEVLAAASEKIKEFTATPEYGELLKKSAEEGAALFGNNYKVYMRQADSKYAGQVKAAGGKCEIVFDDAIQLGGLKFSDISGFRFADDTLDARLSDGRDWFMKNSGLTIR